MQHEITKPQRLLDENGNIKEPGFAKKMLYEYHRSDVKAKNWRIKEWDYYYIGNQHYGIALTIGDNGFAGALSTSILEFDKPYDVTKTALVVFPLGKMNLPETSGKGTTKWTQGKSSYTFENDGKVRHLKGTHAKFDGDNALTFDITLSDFPEESMVIATPFDKNAHFYFNQKINCMRAEGVVKCGNKEWKFDKSDSMGTLDWGAASGRTTTPGTGAACKAISKTAVASAGISVTVSATHPQRPKICFSITGNRINSTKLLSTSPSKTARTII